MKKILIINAGQSQKNHVFKRISELDYHVTVLNPDILEDIEGYTDAWIFADLMNISECLEKIQQEHEKNPFDGILTFWEEDVVLTAQVAERIGLPGIDFELAKKIRNKYEFRKLCEETGIITPKFLSLYDGISEEEIAKNMSFPCIIKPIYGACSAFVRKCTSAEEALKYYKETLSSSQFKIETKLGNVKDLFLEGFISGQEVDIDMIVQNGEIKYISISDNFDIQNGFFVEVGQACPSHLERGSDNQLRKQAQNIIEKIGITNGCLHFEAKIENNIVIPIELNLRMGGDEVWYFNREVYGADLVELAVKIACGENIQNLLNTTAKCHVHGEYFLPTKAGVINKISINQESLLSLGVIKYEMRKKVGDKVDIPPNDFGFLGWYIVKKEISDSQDYYVNDERIKACFDIKIEE